MSRSHLMIVTFAVVTLGSAGVAPGTSAAAVGGKDRGFVAARFALEIGGVVTGWIDSVEGGGAVGEEVTTGNAGDSKKHIGGTRFEDIDIGIATPIPPAVLAWMKDTLAGNFRRQSGAVVTTDYEGRVVERLEFTDALLTEIVFPSFDAASREFATLSIRLSPERTRLRKGSSGARLELPRPVRPALRSTFRLTIDRLPTARVAAVEGLAVKLKVIESEVGAEVSNLVVRLALTDAAPYADWLEDFVVNGNNSDDRERSGTLDLMSAEGTRTLLSIGLHHIGIVRMTSDRRDSGSESVPRVAAELYCESISLAGN